MKTLLAVLAGLLVVLSGAHAADVAQWAGTGDRTLDATLQQMTLRAKLDSDGFLKQLSSWHGVPEQDLRQAQETYRFGPADLFMAAALAKAAHRPILSIAEEYQKNEGRGWGVMAKDLGIKPGSREFHELKRSARGCRDQMNAHAKVKAKQDRELRREQERKGKLGRDGESGKGRGHGGHP